MKFRKSIGRSSGKLATCSICKQGRQIIQFLFKAMPETCNSASNEKGGAGLARAHLLIQVSKRHVSNIGTNNALRYYAKGVVNQSGSLTCGPHSSSICYVAEM